MHVLLFGRLKLCDLRASLQVCRTHMICERACDEHRDCQEDHPPPTALRLPLFRESPEYQPRDQCIDITLHRHRTKQAVPIDIGVSVECGRRIEAAESVTPEIELRTLYMRLPGTCRIWRVKGARR
jgi:hypothetical protein